MAVQKGLLIAVGASLLASPALSQTVMSEDVMWAQLRGTDRDYIYETCGLLIERDCLVRLWDRTVSPHDEAEINRDVRAVLGHQVVSWNFGDIDGFMEGYWKSPNLRFVSGDTVTEGYDTVLARYRAGYPNRAAMGSLSFTDLNVAPIALDEAYVTGTWRLVRDEPASGQFLLHFRKLEEGWRIVEDVTTSD